MDEHSARVLIFKHFSDLKINEIKKIGEGTGNIAYEVNTDLIFRFPKSQENQKQLEKEISLQKLLKKYSSLPFPSFIFLPEDHSFVGYKKLPGTQLLFIHNEFKAWDSFSQQIGHFLSKLHTVPVKEINELDLSTENKSLKDWQDHSKSFYEKTKYLIPEYYFPNIDKFFHFTPRYKVGDLVLCHNDLGIEHILISENKITGIIDWGGAALTDPACDFARIYRDLGEKVLDEILTVYCVSPIDNNKLRDRAIFYGKCLLFEDLFYGAEQEKYLEKALAALEWMF